MNFERIKENRFKDIRNKLLLYHLTKLDNLDDIIKNGLLSRKSLLESNTSFADIADPEIITKRDVHELDDYIPFHFHPYSDFEVPTALPGVDPAILDPRDTYADAAEWDTKAKDLAARFVKNFAKYTTNDAGKALVAAGPKVD